jgi:hypothetical protein
VILALAAGAPATKVRRRFAADIQIGASFERPWWLTG